MICPQTKAECKNLAFCDMTGKCLEHEADLLTPPPPTLAEIERLVDAYGKQQYELGHAIGSRASFATGAEFERAALLSAIQKLLA